MVPHRLPVSSALALLAFAAASPAQKPPEKAAGLSGYDAALARYKECLERKPFTHHTEGRERLAATQRPDALQILMKDYVETKAYPEYTRYTLAELFGRHFATAESIEPLAKLRKEQSKPVDTWLWVQSLKVQSDATNEDEAMAIVHDNKNQTLRAAAIAALGKCKRPKVGPAITAACIDFPKKEADRSVLIGAMAGAIYDNRSRLREDDFKAGVAAFIGLLAPTVNLTHGQKLTIERHLKWTLNAPALFTDPEPWLELLQHGETKAPTKANTGVQQRFFGIESDGNRICYVIDMSDSMCKELSPDVRPKAAVTGPRKKAKGELPDESDLPWAKIRTRFDLAREELRISLLRLPKEKHFAVIWFGDGFDTFAATKGLVPASTANVERVIAELEGIPQKPAVAGKAPDGELRGGTNLHGGLCEALSLSSKGAAKEAAFVDPAVLTEGCDTVFLLTDGVPSLDEFGAEDKDYGEGEQVLNTEYNAKVARLPRTVYHGPFVVGDWLVRDIARLNTFHRARIHCVGIGEASMGLLREIADIGHGETFDVGRAKSAAAPPGPRPK